MCEYIVQHFYFLQSLSYTDIEKAAIDWTPYRVPLTYAAKVIKVNPPLTEEEFYRE
jgi:hypothetical protein